MRSYCDLNLTINSRSMITIQNYVKMLVEKFMHYQEQHHIWIFQKDIFLWKRSLYANLVIVPICGCVIDLLTTRLHKRCLQIINKQSLFEALLEKSSSASIHNCNLRILPIEMYEIKNDLSPLIVTEFLKKKEWATVRYKK